MRLDNVASLLGPTILGLETLLLTLKLKIFFKQCSLSAVPRWVAAMGADDIPTGIRLAVLAEWISLIWRVGSLLGRPTRDATKLNIATVVRLAIHAELLA